MPAEPPARLKFCVVGDRITTAGAESRVVVEIQICAYSSCRPSENQTLQQETLNLG